MNKPLQFGLYTEIMTSLGRSYKKRIDETMRLIELGDALGYKVFHTLEHHFFQTFSISTNPLAMFAAAAQRTKHIRFRAMCHTLPVHNPLILAGEIAEADLLCNGRLDVGVGRGHGWLFEPAGENMLESQGRYDESIEILFQAWTKEKFSFEGKYYHVHDVSVVPKPLQQPHPPIYMTGTSGKSFEVAAKRGWGIVVGGPAPFTIFQDAVKAYKDACQQFGTQPKIGFALTTYLTNHLENVRKEVEEDLLLCYRNLAVPQATIKTEEQKEKLREAGYSFYASGSLNEFNNFTYEKILESKIAFVGTAEQLVDRIHEMREAIGFDELYIMPDFGNLQQWQVHRTVELVAEKIMPILG